MDIKMVSHAVMVKRQANKGLSTRFLRVEWLKNQVTYQKRTRASSAFFGGCGMIFPTSFQPSQDGDMVCARGPLGACVATCHNVGNR
jgi:hypothetical protein